MTNRLRWAMALVVILSLGGAWWLARPGGGADEIEAAQQALTAWGLFAGDGDASRLGETFGNGPQLAQLRQETIEPGPPYTFTLSEASVIAPGFVIGTVTVTRPGEVVQVFRWEIELRGSSGDWKVWTVRTAG